MSTTTMNDSMYGVLARSWSPAPGSAGVKPGASVLTYAPSSVIEDEGETTPTPRLILGGWAARVCLLADGRRQIVRFLVPGDLCGIPIARGAPSPCATVALTKVALTHQLDQGDEALAERAGERRLAPPRAPAPIRKPSPLSPLGNEVSRTGFSRRRRFPGEKPLLDAGSGGMTLRRGHFI